MSIEHDVRSFSRIPLFRTGRSKQSVMQCNVSNVAFETLQCFERGVRNVNLRTSCSKPCLPCHGVSNAPFNNARREQVSNDTFEASHC